MDGPGKGKCPFPAPHPQNTPWSFTQSLDAPPPPAQLQRVNGHRSQEGCLERNIIIADGSRGRCRLGFVSTLVEIISSSGGATRASREVSSTAGFSPAAQQNQIVNHDFSHVFLLPGLLIVPGVGSQTSFDVHLPTLLEIFARNFRGSSPGGDVVPLGAVLPLTFFVLVAVVSGQRELGHRSAAGRGPDFGILA